MPDIPETSNVDAINDYIKRNNPTAHDLYVRAAKPRGDKTLIIVDEKRSTWFGTPLTLLTNRLKRKWENWVVLEHAKQKLIIHYAQY